MSAAFRNSEARFERLRSCPATVPAFEGEVNRHCIPRRAAVGKDDNEHPYRGSYGLQALHSDHRGMAAEGVRLSKPEGTTEERIERLNGANDRERLPISLVALSQDQGSLVGTANVFATTFTHKHLSPWLSAMFVPPEHRGKGIASALALAAASETGRLGFD